MLSEFCGYLIDQIGQPYLWGGQHTRLTPENYVAVITRKESDPQHRQDAIDFCKRKFDEGAEVLYAYDCSGLGVFWLTDLKHLYKSDMTANALMHHCSDLKFDRPEKGWWVFRCDKTGKATHIGYMVSDTELVEAKGRKYGVVKTVFHESAWSTWGIPDVFYDEIVTPPVPPEPPVTEQYVEVVGKSVRVRSSDSVLGKTQFIAHRGDRFPFVCVAPSGWYQIETIHDESYITSKPKYTKLVET
jgi:hypothetical protein